jgi:4-amino-4-deoxy-L-arabinose transferase-like glycosyltransferase
MSAPSSLSSPGSAAAVPRAILIAAIVLGAGLLALPIFAHSDDGDAHLYRVVIRHLVEDGSWTEPRYLSNTYTPFREHLPFGFWPFVAAARLFGERSLEPLGVVISVAVLALLAWAARRLSGPWAAAGAVLVLAVCESFWAEGGRPKLDPPLMLLANLAALPILVAPRVQPRTALAAWVFGSAAALVKGPFGLVPLVAAFVARAAVSGEAKGRIRTLVGGALLTLLCAVPVAAFLLHDRTAGGGTWWSGYVERQLLASAVGARSDGDFAFYVPFRTLVHRYWPGLPFVILGACWAFAPTRFRPPGLVGTRLRTLRLVTVNAVAMLLILCLPTRKLWFHALVAFPGMSLLAGAAIRELLEWATARGWTVGRFLRGTAITVGAAAVLLWGANATGLSRHLVPKGYLHCAEFGPLSAPHPVGTRAVVVGLLPWHNSSGLAAERDWDVYVEMTTDPARARAVLLDDPAYAQFPVALVEDLVWTGEVPGWEVKGAARGWRWLERVAQVPAGSAAESK